MAEYFVKEGENYVKVEEPLHTQEALDKVIETRLERERKKFANHAELETKVADLTKELEEKSKTWGAEKTELETQVSKAGLEAVKIKIIHEHKLSDDLAEFVNGDSEEAMRGQAEKLAKGVKPASVAIDKEKKPDEKSSSSKVIADKLFGNKSDD